MGSPLHSGLERLASQKTASNDHLRVTHPEQMQSIQSTQSLDFLMDRIPTSTNIRIAPSDLMMLYAATEDTGSFWNTISIEQRCNVSRACCVQLPFTSVRHPISSDTLAWIYMCFDESRSRSIWRSCPTSLLFVQDGHLVSHTRIIRNTPWLGTMGTTTS